jgi:hypothetical protein
VADGDRGVASSCVFVVANACSFRASPFCFYLFLSSPSFYFFSNEVHNSHQVRTVRYIF